MPDGSAPAAADRKPRAAAITSALNAAEFARAMARLGPFGAAPRLAAGVSGGPDSVALALLAADWARARGGDLLGLIVDHGLRPGSAAEAAGVAAMLAGQGIAARILPLGLAPGPGLQDRARAARRAALLAACAAAGRPWLLLGHQRADQAETLLFRALRGSGPAGLAAMAPARAAPAALVLRPLLDVPPARLAAVVAAACLTPVRDPSNHDPRFARTRLRAALGDAGGTGPDTAALAAAAAAFASRRAGLDAEIAARLAACARLDPAGWAELDPAALGADALADAALASLLGLIGGGAFPPSMAAVAALRRRGHGTLAGAWLRPGGARWRLIREPGAVAPPIAARHGAVWDRRFRLIGPGAADAVLGALGVAGVRNLPRSGLQTAILAGLPAIWRHGMLAAVPALDYPDRRSCDAFAMVFCPRGDSFGGG